MIAGHIAAGLAALDIVEAADDLRAKLFENTRYWRAGLADAGFTLLPGEHPIIPVMTGEAQLAQAMAKTAVRTIGSQVGREIVRGVLGSIMGGRRR